MDEYKYIYGMKCIELDQVEIEFVGSIFRHRIA